MLGQVRNWAQALRKSSLQERLEASDVGRALISAFLLVTLIAMVATNAPDSKLRREVIRVADPYLNATGMDQIWSVFAPDPRQMSLGVYARVKYADGSSGIWRLPQGGPVVGEYWDYRWRKWLESVVVDARARQLWTQAAVFVARQEQKGGRRPVEVTLVRRTRREFPPGRKGSDRGRWHDDPYYRVKITARTYERVGAGR